MLIDIFRGIANSLFNWDVLRDKENTKVCTDLKSNLKIQMIKMDRRGLFRFKIQPEDTNDDEDGLYRWAMVTNSPLSSTWKSFPCDNGGLMGILKVSIDTYNILSINRHLLSSTTFYCHCFPVSSKLLKMWTNFAKRSNPTPEDDADLDFK